MDNDKKLEGMMDKLFENYPLEEPSIDFTNNVLRKIEMESMESTVKYKPLLPKWVLYLVYSVLGVLVFAAGFMADFSSKSIVDQLEFSSLLDKVSFNLPELQVSNIVIYGVLALGIMLMFQLVLAKHQFDRRYTRYFN